MKEIKTKRGTVAFGEENILMEENYLDYFRNFYTELWTEGEHHHKITLFLLVFALSYSATMMAAVILFMDFQQLVILAAMIAVIFGLIWGIQRLRGFTADGKISYEDIEDVKLVRGRNWITCPRFVITYTEGEKEKKKRYVAMHSHMIPGVEDTIKEIKEKFESKDIEIS